jgi:hypothetical protein
MTWLLTQAASKGWLTGSDVAVLAPALALLPAYLIAWFKNRPQNIAADMAQVAADPGSPVKGVITTSTPEGVALAKSIPGPLVASAGSSDAAAIAKQGAVT